MRRTRQILSCPMTFATDPDSAQSRKWLPGPTPCSKVAIHRLDCLTVLLYSGSTPEPRIIDKDILHQDRARQASVMAISPTLQTGRHTSYSKAFISIAAQRRSPYPLRDLRSLQLWQASGWYSCLAEGLSISFESS